MSSIEDNQPNYIMSSERKAKLVMDSNKIVALKERVLDFEKEYAQSIRTFADNEKR